MTDETRAVAAAFNERAANYATSHWHRQHAEQLVALAELKPGSQVLDAGTGTGFAAVALARRLGPSGRVTAVDVSAGMLDRARVALDAQGLSNVELLEGDATDLSTLPASSFDAVICSAALLYMPVEKALAEWHRLLRPGGLIGFSAMRAGYPRAGRLFRDCAKEFGVGLDDPSAPLGSEECARAALAAAGFRGDRNRLGRGHLLRARPGDGVGIQPAIGRARGRAEFEPRPPGGPASSFRGGASSGESGGRMVGHASRGPLRVWPEVASPHHRRVRHLSDGWRNVSHAHDSAVAGGHVPVGAPAGGRPGAGDVRIPGPIGPIGSVPRTAAGRQGRAGARTREPRDIPTTRFAPASRWCSARSPAAVSSAACGLRSAIGRR